MIERLRDPQQAHRWITAAGHRRSNHTRDDLRHTFASLLLQHGESVVYVKEQLGHGSIQITVDTYGHLIPGANRAAVDRLDDVPTLQPDATPAQPADSAEADDESEVDVFLGESGEPRWNRTLPAAFSKLLTVRDFWSQVLMCHQHPVRLASPRVVLSCPQSPPLLETFWRRHWNSDAALAHQRVALHRA